jgi:hypothetical protein
MTAVEWLAEELTLPEYGENPQWVLQVIQQAKEMEKNNTDNKVIHFAEWLTKKHTSTLITLYEHFEEEYYNETFKTKKND